MSKKTKPEKKAAALEAREAEIRAELARREKAAKKAKSKKKSKPEPKKIDRSKVKKAKARDVGPIGVDAGMVITAEPEAPIYVAPEYADPLIEKGRELGIETLLHAATAVTAAIVDVAETVLEGNSTDGAKAKAEAALDRVLADPESDAEIKARVQAKRAVRLGLADPATIDRDDADAVKAYNAEAVKVGAVLLTSNAEREKIAASLADAAVATTKDQAVEQVETEHGREFVAGPSVADSPTHDFAKPSEAPKADFETNGNGQYLVKRPSDGKLVGYTRVTSYIAGIEDRSGIEKWKMRVLLEGVAAAEEQGDAATAKVRELAHVRDVAIAKARKADRKGKLAAGELATYVEGAWRDFKKAIDALADELFEIGGGREKATKGTDLHALAELHDREGMQAVADLLTVGQITPADMADVEAYAALVESWGIRFVDVERVVVNDTVAAPTAGNPGRVIGVAGRLDRTGYVKLPGEARARKRVVDLKTGSIEYSAGEIARQLTMYAGAQGYDLDTHEREDLKLDQKTAVVIHLPAGTATAALYAVDLTTGRRGLKIVADMRAYRNDGKKALTLVEHETTVDA